MPAFDECDLWLNNYVMHFYTSGIMSFKKIDKYAVAKKKARDIDRGIATDDKKVEAKSVVVTRLTDLDETGMDEGELYERYALVQRQPRCTGAGRMCFLTATCDLLTAAPRTLHVRPTG